MTHYFGFKPSDKLDAMLNEADELITNGADVKYYPYRNDIAQQIAREIIDNLLVSLIDVIPSPERQASMRKIVSSIESSTEKLLKVLLGKDENKDVLPTFHFLKDDSLFIDNAGERRIGLKLSEAGAKEINESFASVTPESVDINKFKHGLEVMNAEVLDHFITRFTGTLNLGIFKRNAVPLAKSAINTGLGMAINKIFPQLPDEALNRLASFYRPYIVEIDE